eukprot:NODE_343_length_1649_cov_326.419699.p1 GENE.NODE_343_length_1649_cov_326.419699~~NODE_343_length_1649_cov_326.419699.p1  ORF type:complete len:355 (+),score=62.46 NODE_343_length_1649_cov_326.419699:422-1486(+)
MQVSRLPVTAPRNVGCINEREPGQVAWDMAMGRRQQKLDAGYVDGSAPEVSSLPLCMLAQVYQAQGEKRRLDAPAVVVQPKLDGVRCLVRMGASDDPRAPLLFTRRRKVIPARKPLAHDLLRLQESLKSAPGAPREGCFFLDGELYKHGEDVSFQDIVSWVRREPRDSLDEHRASSVEYHVFDCFSEQDASPFEVRRRLLERLFEAAGELKRARLVEAVACGAGEVDGQLQAWLSEGYEGIMVRDPTAPYHAGQRSLGLMKYKRFDDDEFRVVGFHEGTGRDAGAIIWVCETADANTFRVRQMGTIESRQSLYKRAVESFQDSYHGKSLTVRYQGLSRDGIPRFPVGIALRDYE